MGSMTRWLAAALLVAWCGCGFALDGPDPNRPRHKVPICDTSKGLVVLDGLMATTLGVAAMALLANDEAAGALIPLTLGAIYLGGAVSGNKAVDECKQEITAYEQGYPVEERLAGHLARDDEADDEAAARRDRKRARQQQEAPSQQPYPQQPYPDDRLLHVVPPRPQQPAPVQPQAVPVQPQPVPQPAPVQPQPKQKRPAAQPAPPPAADEDDWSDFWREVP